MCFEMAKQKGDARPAELASSKRLADLRTRTSPTARTLNRESGWAVERRWDKQRRMRKRTVCLRCEEMPSNGQADPCRTRESSCHWQPLDIQIHDKKGSSTALADGL